MSAAKRRKRVLVIGGGSGGLEVALTLVRRGHEVMLVEMKGKIEGKIMTASATRYKRELLDLVSYYGEMLDKYCVKIILNRKADRNFIESSGADEVIVAAGSTTRKLEVPGTGGTTVLNAIDVLSKSKNLSGKVVVCGGGETGLEVGASSAKVEPE